MYFKYNTAQLSQIIKIHSKYIPYIPPRNVLYIPP